MFTKKLEDQFSADLLNTVKGVLGEAKHDKECECEKCEDDEDEDEKEDKKKEMKEGKRGLWDNIHAKRKRIKAGSGERMRKPGSEGAPTNADFKAANEEALPDHLKKHFDKNGNPIKGSWKDGKWSPNQGKDVTPKGYGPNEELELGEGVDKNHPIVKEYDSLKKHDIKTLRGMISRNSRVVDTSDFKTKDHAISHLLRQKHGHKKVDQAFGFNEEVEQIDETPKSAAELIKNKIKKAEANAKARDPHTKIERDEARVARMLAARSKQRNEEVEQVDEISKATMGRYINRAKDQIDAASYRQGHRDSRGSGGDTVAKGIERKLSKRHGGIELAVKKLTKEDAEQIDELSKATLGSYVKKATNQAFSKGYSGGSMMVRGDMNRDSEEEKAGEKNVHKAIKRVSGVNKAVSKLTKEEQEFIDALNNDTLEEENKWHVKLNGKRVSKHFDSEERAKRFAEYGSDTQKGKFTVHKSMAEEVELEEGRGRPPKEGSPAWHAKQKQANDDMVALGMQLRKAKSMNKKVRFMDNKEHEVSTHHADRFEDHMAARKTSQDKAAFQKQAHKSHADFVKAVSAPVPKASKDTGEIVKYRH
jgi:hypothetical protein